MRFDPFWRRAMPANFAMLVVAAGACGAAACNSSSSEGRLDAAADTTPAADTAADMTSDAGIDACVDSSFPNPCDAGLGMCTWAQAEQYVCAIRADSGAPGYMCSAMPCAGGFHELNCALDDTVWAYYYDPSGALVAETESEPGGFWRYGACSVDPYALACNGFVDPGCASGDAGQALDSGSPDSSAD